MFDIVMTLVGENPTILGLFFIPHCILEPQLWCQSQKRLSAEGVIFAVFFVFLPFGV